MLYENSVRFGRGGVSAKPDPSISGKQAWPDADGLVMLLKECKQPGVLKFSENSKLTDRGMSIKEFMLLVGVMVLENMDEAKGVVVDSES